MDGLSAQPLEHSPSGLPLLIVPQGADRFHNAERVVAACAAVQLMPGRLTADSARDAVRMLLRNDTFGIAAHRIKNEFDAMPDPQQAVATLEQLTGHEPPQHETDPWRSLGTGRIAPRASIAEPNDLRDRGVPVAWAMRGNLTCGEAPPRR